MEILNAEINIKFTYEGQDTKNIKCKLNDKIEDILKKYALQIEVQIYSLIFLYSGEKIEDFQNTFLSLINKEDKKTKEMNILVYNMTVNGPNIINVILSFESKDIIKKECNKKDIMKNVCYNFAVENGYDFDSLIFKYGGKEINLEKNFDNQANEYDKKCNGMTISVYKKNPLKVNFSYKNKPYEMKCHKEDKIYKVFNDFASKNGLNLNKLSFTCQATQITNLNNNFQEFFISIAENSKSNVPINTDITNTLESNEDDINNMKKLNAPEEILINVDDNNNSLTCSKRKKIIIISSLSIIVILITVILIVKFKNKDEINESVSTYISNSIPETSYVTDSIKETDYISNSTPETSYEADNIKETAYIIIQFQKPVM